MLAAITPMITWAVYFVVVYAVQGLGCDQAWNRSLLLGTNALTLTLVVLTVAALALITWQGARAWPRRSGFQGRVAFALAVLAVLATAFTGIPIVMLEPCVA
ncbi:MAG: hypothetical protein WD081_05515 [Gammaproteobacteria bacterium]